MLIGALGIISTTLMWLLQKKDYTDIPLTEEKTSAEA